MSFSESFHWFHCDLLWSVVICIHKKKLPYTDQVRLCHLPNTQVRLRHLPNMDVPNMDVSKMYASKHAKGQPPETVHKRNVFLCALGRYPWGYVDEVGLLDSDFSAYNQIHAMLHDSNQCDQHVRPSRRRQTTKIQPTYMGQLATMSWREPCFKDSGFSVWVVHVFVWVCEQLRWSWFCAACMCKPTKETSQMLFFRHLICSRQTCMGEASMGQTLRQTPKRLLQSSRSQEPCPWCTVVILLCSLGAAEQSNSSSNEQSVWNEWLNIRPSWSGILTQSILSWSMTPVSDWLYILSLEVLMHGLWLIADSSDPHPPGTIMGSHTNFSKLVDHMSIPHLIASTEYVVRQVLSYMEWSDSQYTHNRHTKDLLFVVWGSLAKNDSFCDLARTNWHWRVLC